MTYSRVDLPVAKNTEKFVTWLFGDLFTTQSSCENLVFYTMRVIIRAVLKNFSFFPRISWLFIILSILPSFKITVFTHKTSIFSLISSPIFKKRYGFCFFLTVFHISCPRFLGLCVFHDICEYNVWIWFSDVLLRLLCGFLVLCCYTSPLVAHGNICCTHTLWHDWDLNVMNFRVSFKNSNLGLTQC